MKTEPGPWKLFVYPDEHIAFRVRMGSYESNADFEIFDSCNPTWSADREGMYVTFHKAGATDGAGMTDNPDEADVFVSGNVKWDGCVNYTHPDEPNCMSHSCGFRSWQFKHLAQNQRHLGVDVALVSDDQVQRWLAHLHHDGQHPLAPATLLEQLPDELTGGANIDSVGHGGASTPPPPGPVVRN